jgi:hypothetical protein
VPFAANTRLRPLLRFLLLLQCGRLCAALSFLALVSVTPAAAQTTAPQTTAPQTTAPQTTAALVDPDLTVGAGATLAVAAGDLVARAESLVLPVRLFKEQGRHRRVANIAYRSAKLVFFDRPQEAWLMVANHEVFGHGGRVRELLNGYLRFHLDAPSPYGDGGGVTTYSPDRDVTVHELQAISIAGMEANAVGAAWLSRRSFAEQRLPPRAALRYLEFQLDVFDYMRHTSDEPERAGHDVSDFVLLHNLAGEIVDAQPLLPRTLRRETWLNLVNPMVASAALSIGTYLATGDERGRVLALPLGDWRVMPGLRYELTPFGTEWELTTDVAWRAHAGDASLRVGRAPLTRPWGVTLSTPAIPVKRWRLAVGGDLWRQPPLALGARPDFGLSVVGATLEWGGAVRGRLESPPIRRSPIPATVIVEAGVKSSGYVKGDPLDGGLVLRAGLGVPLGRR